MSRIAQTIRNHPVVAYFVMVYALAWGIWIPVGILTDGVPVVAVLLGAWAPSISAVILTGYLTGRSGTRLLLRRILLWRVGVQWYLFVLFSAAIIGLAAILLFISLGGSPSRPSSPPGVPRELGYILLPIVFLTNIFIGGPLGEEYGWSGFALPHVQSHMSAFQASLIIGILWGIWHFPFFIFKGAGNVDGNIPAWAFVALTAASPVLFTWVYNNGNGSILLMVLYHAALNTTLGSMGLIDPNTGGATLLLVYVIMTWLVALLVTAIYGPANWREIKGGRDRRDQKGPPQSPIQMAGPVEGDKSERRHQHLERQRRTRHDRRRDALGKPARSIDSAFISFYVYSCPPAWNETE